MATANTQIPEDERGDLIESVVVDPQRSMKQSGAYVKGIVIGAVGVVAGILGVVLLNLAIAWAVVGIFALVIIISAYFLAATRSMASAPTELVIYQVRSGGVLVPQEFFIRWDEIVSANYEWTVAGSAFSVGLGGKLVNAPLTSMMSKHDLDNATRTINFNLADYKATASRSRGMNIGMLMGPLLGAPGFAAAAFGSMVDDERFRNILETTARQLGARGIPFEQQSPENRRAEQAAFAARKQG